MFSNFTVNHFLTFSSNKNYTLNGFLKTFSVKWGQFQSLFRHLSSSDRLNGTTVFV